MLKFMLSLVVIFFSTNFFLLDGLHTKVLSSICNDEFLNDELDYDLHQKIISHSKNKVKDELLKFIRETYKTSVSNHVSVLEEGKEMIDDREENVIQKSSDKMKQQPDEKVQDLRSQNLKALNKKHGLVVIDPIHIIAEIDSSIAESVFDNFAKQSQVLHFAGYSNQSTNEEEENLNLSTWKITPESLTSWIKEESDEIIREEEGE
jgi:hypothetical protein